MKTNPTSHGRRGAAQATWLWLAAAAAAVGLYASSFQVGAGEAAVVLRFGDPSRVVQDAGLHFKLPSPVDTVRTIDMRTHLLDPAPSEFLTEEQRNLEIDAFVAWRVADPRVYITSLQTREGADARIAQVLQAAINDVVTLSPLADLVSVEERERDLAAITEDVRALVAANCEENGYGVEVVYVGFERVTFHADNMPAIEQSMQEERMREVTAIRSTGREAASKILRDAKEEGQSIVSSARKDAETIRGEGEAAATRIAAQAYAQNPELYELLTRLEILEPFLSGQTIVLPSDHPLLEPLTRTPEPREDDAAGGE